MNGVWWTVGAAFLVWLLRIIHRAQAGSRVSQSQEELTVCPIPSYEIIYGGPDPREWTPRPMKGTGIAIKCLRCNMTSWHPKDVEHLYCGNCHEFHFRDNR